MGRMPEVLEACRALFAEATPLRGDCGAVCGAACCASLPGEETGMLLFPGEEAACEGLPGWRVLPAEDGPVAVCPGRCDRAERPLACRVFPLLPLLRGEEIKVAVDARAAAVCPLAREGAGAMRPDFVEAVRACGRLLAADPVQREALITLTRRQDELARLRRRFGGYRHV